MPVFAFRAGGSGLSVGRDFVEKVRVASVWTKCVESDRGKHYRGLGFSLPFFALGVRVATKVMK